MELIIAEKPSVARDLARVLGLAPSGKGAYEGNGRVITWCVGHLVELEEPAAYDGRWKAWRLETLPMLPAEFKLRPAKHAGDQLRRVTALLRERRFDSVVNACDAGREGELIFRYVMKYAGCALAARRLWISSLTDDAIRRGFAALRPAAQFDALGDAARARSEADWLVGMNATRAITVRLREAHKQDPLLTTKPLEDIAPSRVNSLECLNGRWLVGLYGRTRVSAGFRRRGTAPHTRSSRKSAADRARVPRRRRGTRAVL